MVTVEGRRSQSHTATPHAQRIDASNGVSRPSPQSGSIVRQKDMPLTTRRQAQKQNAKLERRGIKETAVRERRATQSTLLRARPVMDEAYIRSHYPFPTHIQYPHIPTSLLSGEKTMLEVLSNDVRGGLKMKHKYTPPKSPAENVWRCTVTWKGFNGKECNAAGEGFTQNTAAKAAYTHVLAKLHSDGMLEALFPVAVQKLDRQTLVDEKDAKFDVYNYAARFVCVPKFSVKQVRSFARHKGASKFMVEVTIALEEQGIEAVGRESDLRAAEVAASVQFKAEAERYHAEHGDQSIVIKDATALNTANVKNFFDFYRIENRNTKLGVSVTGSKEFGNSWEAQATIDGELLGSPVRMESKKAAEEVANLVAAVSLSQEDPDLLERFQEALSGGTGNILAPVRPIGLEVDADTALILSKVVEEVRSVGLPRVAEQLTGDTDSEVTTRTRTQTRLSEREIAIRSEAMMRRQDAFRAEPKLAEKRALKESLPMTQYREKVLEQVVNNMYSVIVGATGSGKTTQVPQILLEDAISHNSGAKCNIVCTQPRRIAATSVARRVASERNEELQDTVGYQVRFDAKLPQPGGSITYCTTGILLQQLQRAPDEVFDSLSHIIIDEVHERDIIIDFLMIILKKTVSARLATGKSVPRVVLMSATIDTELFAKYFQQSTPEGGLLPCPSLSVPGRTFPVKEKYYNEIVSEMEQSNPSGLSREITSDPVTREYMNLESSFKATTGSSAAQDENGEATIDWKRERTLAADGSEVFNEKEDGLVPVALVAATIAHITRTTSEGAILVFLPGYDEIKKVADTLRTTSPLGIDFNNEAAFKLSMLHSSVPAAEQAEVFAPVPADCRKIILSTNIAETSVTIPDVQHVVDTGKLREKRYDQLRRITKLQCTWISKSNAKQRAGRAGRVQNGNYYALYSKARFESLRAVGLPEMLRSDLQEICLDIKAQAFKSPIRDFLSESIEPPPPAAVDASVVNLKALQALTEDEKLTALGRLLASLPVHPSLGKMIVLGVIFRCLDPMIILGAALNERSPFVAPPDKRQEARQAHTRFLQGSGSDHVAVINAVRQMRLGSLTHGQHAMHEFGIRNFIHTGAFRTIHQTAQQIEEVLVNASLIPRPTERDRLRGELGNASLNKNSANVQLIKALTLAGVHPNLAVSNGNSFRTPGEKHAMLHPSSLNFNQNMRRRVAYEDSAPTSLYSYTTMNRSNDGKQILLRDTTACSPLMAALFGGRLKDQRNIITMDKWLPFYVKGDWGAARKIMDFRSVLDILLQSAFSSLAKLKPRDRNSTGSASDVFLANDAAREIFAAGLVILLDHDAANAPQPAPQREDSGTSRYKQEYGGSKRYREDTKNGKDRRSGRESFESERSRSRAYRN